MCFMFSRKYFYFIVLVCWSAKTKKKTSNMLKDEIYCFTFNAKCLLHVHEYEVLLIFYPVTILDFWWRHFWLYRKLSCTVCLFVFFITVFGTILLYSFAGMLSKAWYNDDFIMCERDFKRDMHIDKALFLRLPLIRCETEPESDCLNIKSW